MTGEDSLFHLGIYLRFAVGSARRRAPFIYTLNLSVPFDGTTSALMYDVMSGSGVVTAAGRHAGLGRPLPIPLSERLRRLLIGCGIAAAVLYTGMTVFVGMLWEGYSATSQTISELSAIGAPTRPLWMLLGTLYTALMLAFGWIVWTSAPPNRALRVVGALLMIQAVFGFFWPPMHQRAVLAAGGHTLTDTMHIAWTVVTGVLFMFTTGFGAAALGRQFRAYSIATMVVVFGCGAATGAFASRLEADLPTPWMGLWERVSSAGYMLWVVVLATALRHSKGR